MFPRHESEVVAPLRRKRGPRDPKEILILKQRRMRPYCTQSEKAPRDAPRVARSEAEARLAREASARATAEAETAVARLAQREKDERAAELEAQLAKEQQDRQHLAAQVRQGGERPSTTPQPLENIWSASGALPPTTRNYLEYLWNAPPATRKFLEYLRNPAETHFRT